MYSPPPRIALLALATLLLAAYPLLVWAGLARVGAPTLLGLLLALLGVRVMIAARGRLRQHGRLLGLMLVTAGAAAMFVYTGDEQALRWYPVVASLFASGVFTVSLFSGMPVIERFARLRESALPPEGVAYTRKLTVIWAALTFGNALIAAWTALFATLDAWALYNGLLSYLLLGGFFCAEWLYRRHRFQEA